MLIMTEECSSARNVTDEPVMSGLSRPSVLVGGIAVAGISGICLYLLLRREEEWRSQRQSNISSRSVRSVFSLLTRSPFQQTSCYRCQDPQRICRSCDWSGGKQHQGDPGQDGHQDQLQGRAGDGDSPCGGNTRSACRCIVRRGERSHTGRVTHT